MLEQHLKRRLFGAVVTVIAIAIVLPIILNTQYLPPLKRSEIPERPGIALLKTDTERAHIRQSLEQLASGETRRDMLLSEPAVVVADDAPVNGVNDDQMALDKSNVPITWTLQVGAFGNIENANSYRDRLRSEGFKSYTLFFSSANITRVYVGPFLTRKEAEQSKQTLIALLDEPNIYIRRYEAEP